jgi:hypothetical protein
MSAKEPTAPKDSAAAVSPAEHWRELEGRTAGPTIDEKSTLSQVEPEDDAKEHRRRRGVSRRARFAALASLVIAVAPAWVVVLASVTGESASRSPDTRGVVHAEPGKAERRSWSLARRAKGAGEIPRLRQRRTARRTPRAGRHTHPRWEPRRPAPPAEAPSRSPASGATPPELTPEPSAPAPVAPSEPKEAPGLRDGATESTEFGL